MATLQVSVQIDASPDEVWRAVEDIASHRDWMLDAAEIRFVGGQRSGVGTVFDCDTRLGPLRLTDRMTITEWRPGRAMGVAHTGVVTGTGRFTIKRLGRRRGGGTRFRWEERLRFPWWLGGPVGALAAKPLLRAVWRRSLRNLKAIVEAGAPQAGTGSTPGSSTTKRRPSASTLLRQRSSSAAPASSAL